MGMTKKDFTNMVKEFAKSCGADIVGVAPVNRFDEAPEGFHPTDIIDGAKSVISIGIELPLGVVMGKSRASMTKTISTTFNALDHCAYRIACYIEKTGALTVSVPSDSPCEWYDVEKQEGRGDLSQKHAAFLSGLGELGKSSMFLCPEFGNKVSLGSVVTTMELESDSLFDGKLCIENCNKCITSCPAGAIQEDGTVIQKECKKYHNIITAKGLSLFNCWECRRVCPVRGAKI